MVMTLIMLQNIIKTKYDHKVSVAERKIYVYKKKKKHNEQFVCDLRVFNLHPCRPSGEGRANWAKSGGDCKKEDKLNFNVGRVNFAQNTPKIAIERRIGFESEIYMEFTFFESAKNMRTFSRFFSFFFVFFKLHKALSFIANNIYEVDFKII